jgi:general secretion pathway protein G
MTFERKQQGFTLLEIMLVVTIIALLLGTAIYKLAGNVEYARHTRVQADIQGIDTQLKLYESMNGCDPTRDRPKAHALVSIV